MACKEANAIDLLREDHSTLKTLLVRLSETRAPAVRTRTVRQICDEVTAHVLVDEEIFYPALSGSVDGGALGSAVAADEGLRLVLEELRALDPRDRFFKSRAAMLCAHIEQHIRAEERPCDGLFSQAGRSGLDLNEVGRRIAVRRSELLAAARQGTLPPFLSAVAAE